MPNSHLIYVIFGASGDLTKRKLIPALYSLFVQDLLPQNFVLLGASRTQFSDGTFREIIRNSINEFREIDDTSRMDEFIERIHYFPVTFNDANSYLALKQRIESLRKVWGTGGNTLFYLSTPPGLYEVIPQQLASVGLNREDDGWKRLIVEKPFGFDLSSALALRDSLLNDWSEEQLFRIDHYLGKETVQNLLVTRFSNGIFEPLWNRNFIDHIEITSAERLGVEMRGGYYESSGALRDMVQNHLLQMAALTAMEPPSSLEPAAIRNEILKVLQSLRPIKREEVKKIAIRGQYTSSSIKGRQEKGYREEEGVDSDSKTETFAALKFYIDNWRWGGVPFYLRTGKRLPTRVTEVVVHFKPTPHFLFANQSNGQSSNKLVIRIQPDDGILLTFGMKTPGAGFEAQNVSMDFHYADLAAHRIPSAYERLIFDSIKGDATLFARSEEVIEAWKFLTPVLESWKNDPDVPLYGYPAGSWGPEQSDDLFEARGITWRYPCKNLSGECTYCEL